MLVGVNICNKKWKPGLKFGNGQFHCNGITFREIFFNHHSIAEHVNWKLINYRDSSANNEISSVSRKNLTELSVSFFKLPC